MTTNYSLSNAKPNVKKFLFCIVLFLAIFSQQAYAQCAQPVVGCPNTNLSNFGTDSDNNAATLEYDNYISSFHTTIVRTATGALQTWGEDIGANGTDDLASPTIIDNTFSPLITTSTPLKAALASNYVNAVQGILLTTDGLYAWSTEGIVLDGSITTSVAFQKVTINGNANGLPTGVVPGDVKMMFAMHQTLVITTCSGDVWVISQNANVRGAGATATSATQWYRVIDTNNANLTGIIACRGSFGALMALKSDGTLYVWGNSVYQGNNTAVIATQNRALVMTSPTTTPKMIGSTTNQASGNNHSFYVLSTDGNLYALGENSNRQLGDWTVNDRQAWVQPRYTAAAPGGTVMNNIKWFSPQEHDSRYAFMNVVNNARNIYAFGDNETSAIGTTNDPSNPEIPGGLTTGDLILTVETGGHTSMVVRNCSPNFGYVGHRIRGSMGNGSLNPAGGATETSYTFATAAVQICGAESIPIIQPIALANGPSGNYCAGSPVQLVPSPDGGTLSVISGPGNLTGNILNFTGPGSVVVRYTLPAACNGSTLVNRTFNTVYCSTDLGVTKTISNNTPNVGTNVTFTITATNHSTLIAYGASVADALPAGYTMVGSPTLSTGTYASGVWTIGTMAAGAVATMTITATVNATGSYTNTATISSSAPDTVTANNSASVTPVPVNVLVAVNDATVTVPSSGTATTIAGTVISNDTLNGVAVTTTNTNVTPQTTGPLSVDANGIITLAANTPSGSYSITYTICEANPGTGLNIVPANCATATKIVNVGNTIVAVNDATVTVPSSGTAITIAGTVISNDTLNGVAVTTTNTNVTPQTTGPLSVDADGIITLAANTPSGSYSITYTICEANPTGGANVVPANCATATKIVNVGNTIVAVNDATVTVPSSGTATTIAGTVISNDTLNGVAVTTTNTNVTPQTTGPLSVDADGIITLAANTPSGSYSITYTICEANPTGGANVIPANCATATKIVNVGNTIVAVNDATVTVPSSGTATTIAGTVISNDTLNGVAVTTTNTNVTPQTTGPLSVDADGIITLAANTPSGSYSITYTICEANPGTGLNIVPANCATATKIVNVGNTIVAVNDATVTVPSSGTATTIAGTVISNDTLNGVAVTTTNTNVTPQTTGPLSVDADGIITLAANTPSGSYSITYTICEANPGTGANVVPANCATATKIVNVGNTIVAVNDATVTVPSSGTATTIAGTVISNDTLNGVAVTTTNTNVTPQTTGPLSVDADGIITLAANTPSGSYSITYTICEANPTGGANVIPANCATATKIVNVGNTIVAVNDATVTVPSSGTATTIAGTVISNDTLNGVVVTTTNTNVTPQTTGPLSVDADGIITLAANTPSGSYSITYTICEANPTGGANVVPANCATATKIVNVGNTIVAVNDATVTVPSSGTATTIAGTVISNDTLNGVVVTTTNTNVTPQTTGPLSVDADGIITLAANTPSGSYSITYTICEANPGTGLNIVPANCATATKIVNVANTIVAVNDATVTVATGTTATTIAGTVISNDTLNGVAVTTTNTNVTPQTTGPLSVDADGIITLAANTPSGSYSITYTICEANPTGGANIIPANCATATKIVNVGNTIVAVNDATVTVPSSGTATTIAGTVISNDTLNGVAVTTTYTNVTPQTTGPLSVDADGIITLAANTPSGSYSITYTICEANPTGGANVVPANCATATKIVNVGNTIVAVNDATVTVPSSGTATTIAGTVISNDTLNGVAVTTTNTNVTPQTTGPLSVDADGIITLAANTPSGSYSITYTICEANPTGGANVIPANCATATKIVNVGNTIVAVNDATVTVPSSGTATTIAGTVISNDTLNGVAVTTTNTNVTPQTTGPLSVDADGIITLAANTPSGSYSITYTICEANPTGGANVVPANCATATKIVNVSNTIVAVNDATVTVPSSGTSTTIAGTVISNDTLNGVAVTTTNTNVTPQTTGPLSVDADGIITLAANTPSGSYSITYTICEANPTGGANVIPANCATATKIVNVGNTIVAVNDATVTVPSSGTATTIAGTVISNDTLNGVAVTTTNTNVTPQTTGPLSVDADGIITLAANTPSGSYSITYTICEANPTGGANVIPANCATATKIVNVGNTIVAVNDATVTVPSSGTATTIAGTVISNDTLNGVAVMTTNTNVTPQTTGPLSVDADGIITLAANTPSGSYSITYTICEANPGTGLNIVPANCATAIKIVNVLNPIDAVTDTYNNQVPGTVNPTTVGNVTTNDTLNGVPVTANNTDVTPITTGPLSIDANGVLTLAPNTPSGSYSITYQLCEVNPVTNLPVTPANCDTAVATVTVTNPIDAVNDTYNNQVPGTVNPTTVGNVTTNDTLNGVPVTANNTDVTPITTGPLSINANGVLTLAPNTPSGSYSITYQLCEVNPVTNLPVTPANCDTAVATVTVTNPIDAVNDTYNNQIPGTVNPTTVGNVTTNDTLNGVPVTANNTDVTPITTGPLSIDTNGVLTLAPNTPSGSYSITYQLCEVNPVTNLPVIPANCDTAVATVTVTNPIDAVNDTYNNQVPGTVNPTTVGNVTTNDTLNGQPVTANNTDVTPITTGPLSIDANGVLTLAPNTPSGSYSITYQLCEVNPVTNLAVIPANCDTAVATVTVTNPIDAVTDTYNNQIPGTVNPTTVGNVTTNDTLNGQPVTANNTDVTPITAGPLSIDANGVLTLTPNTPSGSYSITYQLCEVNPVTNLPVTPANCDTAVATVNVTNPIDAVTDTYNNQVPGTVNPTTVGNVTTNDTLNGQPVTANNTDVTPITTGPLSINANGVLTLAPNTPSGSYSITYQLCEVNPVTNLPVTPANCDTAVATVTVTNPIDAVNDTYNNQVPGTIGNVTSNDTLNGVPVTAANTDVTPVTNGPLSINNTGILTVAPNTPSGTYTITYQLCEVNPSSGLAVVPANCDTATVTVNVLNPIDAVDNTYNNQISGPVNPIIVGNVTSNDTLNGQPVTAANTDVTPVTNGPLSIGATGIITLAPNTPSGIYTITYQLCEVNPTTNLPITPANCDTAIATVNVVNPIDAVNNNFVNQVPGMANPVVVGNVTTNDTLNGQPVTAANTDVTPVTAGPLSIDASGVLTLAPNTPTGTYTITYQLCEVNPTTGAPIVPANCDTAVVTVSVFNPIDAVNDTYNNQVSGTVNPTTVGNVTINDTLNGVPVTAANTDVTPVTNGPLSINAAGVLTMAPNTPSGSYSITYQLCEVNPVTNLPVTPANCDTAVATVNVVNPIDAVNDTLTAPSGTAPGIIGSVIPNDTLNGQPVTASNTNVTPVTNGPISIDVLGNVTLAPNTPSGTYTITYQLCEANPLTLQSIVPANCDTAVLTVVVNNVIVANDDTNIIPINGATGGVAIPTVLVNDTINGAAVTQSQVTITLTSVLPAGITFNTITGQVSVSPQTAGGTYTFTYNICEVGAVPAHCDPATVTIVVAVPPIVAENDNLTTTPVNGFTGGTPGNIFFNNGNGQDTLNGVPVNSAQVAITVTNNGGVNGVAIANDGTVNVPAGTPAGTYTITYMICEVLNQNNCDTATVTFVVTAPPIDAVNDMNNPPVNAAVGAAVPLHTNDTLNNQPLNPSDVTFTLLDDGGISGAYIDAQGNLIVPVGVAPGTYTITYQICEVTNPTNCDTAIAVIVVREPCDFDNSPDACDIIVHNYISVNNDTYNEAFILDGILRYPNNNVTIYNRWGVLVYEARGYNNTDRVFKGISEGRVTYKGDSNLPDGTYFYVLRYTKTNGEQKERAGYLYIIKK